MAEMILPEADCEISPEGEAELLTLEERYQQALALATQGDTVQARLLLQELWEHELSPERGALVANDLAVLAVLSGNLPEAEAWWQRALERDPECVAARTNLELACGEGVGPARNLVPADHPVDRTDSSQPAATRVAILSLLFNWPSTGGGTIHTAELGRVLEQSGCEVQHLYARYAPWGLGDVTDPPLQNSVAVEFDPGTWHAAGIVRRFRAELERFAPDVVLITDSWNSKPLLAEAAAGYPYWLRYAAQEGLCPLNNVRLLGDGQGGFRSCPQHQFATPDACRSCVRARQQFSGSLHQAERELVGYGTPEYDRQLRRTLQQAAAVLAVNPLIAAALQPYNAHVQVVPSGFDSARFPWPWPADHLLPRPEGKSVLVFAGLVDEPMKGFHVLEAACRLLAETRRDFELWVTANAPQAPAPWARYLGWQTQQDLPRVLRTADIVVFPTVAEEALGRTAVEAMGVGRPVVASRIGGLPFTILDEATGLLAEPGDPRDLARQLTRLLDDSVLRERLGAAGRRRFEEHYTWERIFERHYRPLLSALPARRDASTSSRS